MTRRLLLLPLLAAFAAVPLLVGEPAPAQANHSWGNYHWSSTSNPFTLSVGDNVSSTWDARLDAAIAAWNAPTGTFAQVVRLQETNGRSWGNCRPTLGRIEVCNASYGWNGWLGIAQIWLNSSSHITQGVAKMNDTYHNRAPYNTIPWRQLVMCQEIAHDFGLNHQDETFNNPNLGTCMDYTNAPDGGGFYGPSNVNPNDHDFQQLVTIYRHTHSSSTATQTTQGTGQGRNDTAADEGPNNPDDFGRPAGPKDGYGRDIVYTKDVGNGQKLVTHVTWALPNTGPGTRPSR